MKIFLGIVVIGFLLIADSYAGVTTGYKFGKGPLKVTKNTADTIEYYFSGGRMGVYKKKQKDAWGPGLMAISVDGTDSSIIRHPATVRSIQPSHYAGQVIKSCKKRSGKECFLFANAYKIVWDNGSNKKKRKLKRKDIRAGKTIALLTELGFFDGSNSSALTTTTSKKTKKNKKKKESKSDKDIVKKLKDLKDLLDTGVLSKEEFEKAKKKLLN